MLSHAGPFLEKLMENYFRVENDKLEQIAEACGSTSFMVYCFIAKYANQSGKCWPSINHISEKLKISVPTVNRAIKSLDDNGFIIREKRSRKNNLYRIPKSEKSADCVRENSPDISPVIHDDISPVIHYKEKSYNKGQLSLTSVLDLPLSFLEYTAIVDSSEPVHYDQEKHGTLVHYSKQAIFEAVVIFLEMYQSRRGEQHPKLRASQWEKYVHVLSSLKTPNGKVSFLECNPEAVFEKYFDTEFNPGNGQRCDYRLPHFCSMANSCNFLYEASVA